MLAMHLLRAVDGEIKGCSAIEDDFGLNMRLGMELLSKREEKEFLAGLYQN